MCRATVLAVTGVDSIVHHPVLVDLVIAHFHLDLKHLLHAAGEAWEDTVVTSSDNLFAG